MWPNLQFPPDVIFSLDIQRFMQAEYTQKQLPEIS